MAPHFEYWTGPLLGLALGLLAAGALTAGLRRWARMTDEARRRAEALLGSLPTAVVAFDPTGRVLASNAAAEELWGASLPRGLNWRSFLLRHPWLDEHGIPLDPGDTPLSRILERGGREVRTGAIFRSGAVPAPIVTQAVPLHGPGRRPLGVVCTFEPAPELQTAGRVPGPSDVRAFLLERMCDALPQPLLLLDESGRVNGINEAARLLLGLRSQTDALGPATKLIRLLQPRTADGRGGQPLTASDWLPLRALAGDPPGEQSLVLERPDGGTVHITSRVALFGGPGGRSRYALWLPTAELEEAEAGSPSSPPETGAASLPTGEPSPIEESRSLMLKGLDSQSAAPRDRARSASVQRADMSTRR